MSDTKSEGGMSAGTTQKVLDILKLTLELEKERQEQRKEGKNQFYSVADSPAPQNEPKQISLLRRRSSPAPQKEPKQISLLRPRSPPAEDFPSFSSVLTSTPKRVCHRPGGLVGLSLNCPEQHQKTPPASTLDLPPSADDSVLTLLSLVEDGPVSIPRGDESVAFLCGLLEENEAVGSSDSGLLGSGLLGRGLLGSGSSGSGSLGSGSSGSGSFGSGLLGSGSLGSGSSGSGSSCSGSSGSGTSGSGTQKPKARPSSFNWLQLDNDTSGSGSLHISFLGSGIQKPTGRLSSFKCFLFTRCRRTFCSRSGVLNHLRKIHNITGQLLLRAEVRYWRYQKTGVDIHWVDEACRNCRTKMGPKEFVAHKCFPVGYNCIRCSYMGSTSGALMRHIRTKHRENDAKHGFSKGFWMPDDEECQW